jgi:hypothetical protein
MLVVGVAVVVTVVIVVVVVAVGVVVVGVVAAGAVGPTSRLTSLVAPAQVVPCSSDANASRRRR